VGRQQVHRWQPARDWGAAIHGDARGVAAHTLDVAPIGSSSMMRQLLRRVAMVTGLSASIVMLPARVQAQSDTSTTSFEINGLKVILRRNTANDVVAANVYLLGGSQQLTPATQ